ncbi:TIGR03986 family CRISPR-associated RAMP protein [Lyngbya sp. PCC 8106]|uniref:TIGR03986 family type III CRISPR-associated RAMP protein n=1 Tax=Lyngbya sp. (strain PCC 8106) TaxID=313612 RepID=UPI0000EAA230|nr:TIGR03986 family CRISPR-associated RAMP protein [Lyngbya sp. PCC 8106]EAW36935.1 hypothetical protein L8106_21012 [Lyngbya sp. PCC 8106]
MSPKHISKVDSDRKAIAPYNFVELPEKVVEAELPLPEGDRYYSERHTGRIECTLTTESPLYTRGGWSPEDFAEYGETPFNDLPPDLKQKRSNFFINPATNQPVIPGSSIRGMLRTLVEIVSFGKIDRVSGNDRLFFRAVGSNPDKESWGQEYKEYVSPEIIKAGYLVKRQDDWYIQLAKTEQGATFAWVRETPLNLQNFKKFNDDKYELQYINVSYQNVAVDNTDRAKRLFAHDVDLPDTHYKKGVLITSGNMKQGDKDSPRRNHCIVFPENIEVDPLPIDDTAIEHYRNALTDFQKKLPFEKDWGVLKEGRPVFYYHDGKSKTVGFFGQSPNFRIPYSPEGNGHATTVLDFIPTIVSDPYVINWNNAPIRYSVTLLNINFLIGILFVAIPLIDIADAIFGWVKQEFTEKKLPKDFNKQRASRVFVTDALYQTNENDIWYSKTPVIPQILSEPKPSYFPHYLVQKNAVPKDLKHYASEPLEKTVIRGHKLYWHKGSNPQFKLKRNLDKRNKSEDSDTQTTLITPINKGVTFKFDIHFENLSDVELGALLWVLSLSSDKSQQLETGKTGEQYCFSLGIGKPLGMGAVKIDYELHLSDRKKRYSQLFENEQWSNPPISITQTKKSCVKKFENYILDQISEDDYPKDHNRQQLEHLKQIPRIEMLLAMLRCDKTPDSDQTRYMEIECNPSQKKCIGKPKKDRKVNEYADRPVLPTPLDIMDISDNRRLPKDVNSSLEDKTKNQVAPPKLKQKKSSQDQEKTGGNINLATQRPTQRPNP